MCRFQEGSDNAKAAIQGLRKHQQVFMVLIGIYFCQQIRAGLQLCEFVELQICGFRIWLVCSFVLLWI